MEKSNTWLKNGWFGEMQASRVFWRYAVPINLLFFTFGVLVGALSSEYPDVAYSAFLVIPIYQIFMIWFCVALWRCAFNSSWIGWGYISRLWASLVGVGLALQIGQITLRVLG